MYFLHQLLRLYSFPISILSSLMSSFLGVHILSAYDLSRTPRMHFTPLSHRWERISKSVSDAKIWLARRGKIHSEPNKCNSTAAYEERWRGCTGTHGPYAVHLQLQTVKHDSDSEEVKYPQNHRQ
ncbi:hypothetical protein B0H13DRAFT_1855049 [Mycena leptocephala]|nr:hypothetical protein B0H13DRAFT_1855049 [Mycena leptocephala]